MTELFYRSQMKGFAIILFLDEDLILIKQLIDFYMMSKHLWDNQGDSSSSLSYSFTTKSLLLPWKTSGCFNLICWFSDPYDLNELNDTHMIWCNPIFDIYNAAQCLRLIFEYGASSNLPARYCLQIVLRLFSELLKWYFQLYKFSDKLCFLNVELLELCS